MGHRSLLLGHRGWSAKHPENTLPSFIKALDYGLDGVEFDVQMTQDEVPVIIHDETLERTTDGHGKVSDWLYASLTEVNAAARWNEAARTPIPTLESVLDEVYRRNPYSLYNIEIKVYNNGWRELVNKVLDTVGSHPAAKNVLYSSFDHKCLEYLRHRNAEAKLGFLYEDYVSEPWLDVRELNGYSVNLNYQLATLDLIQACHSHNTRVSVWTVDEPSDLEQMMHWHTDIIISNAADVARRVLESSQHRT